MINKELTVSKITINIKFADKCLNHLHGFCQRATLKQDKNVGLIRQIGISANDVVKEIKYRSKINMLDLSNL